MSMYTCMYVRMSCAHTITYIHTHIYIYICMYMYVYTCVYIYIERESVIYIYVNVRTHVSYISSWGQDLRRSFADRPEAMLDVRQDSAGSHRRCSGAAAARLQVLGCFYQLGKPFCCRPADKRPTIWGLCY